MTRLVTGRPGSSAVHVTRTRTVQFRDVAVIPYAVAPDRLQASMPADSRP
jgi:hypothetical protein